MGKKTTARKGDAQFANETSFFFVTFYTEYHIILICYYLEIT